MATQAHQATTLVLDTGTQAKRLQIDVTSKISLRKMVMEVARNRGVLTPIAARDLLQDGLAWFDHESKVTSPQDLLVDYERRACEYEGLESESWTVPADRRLVMKTRLRAGEYNCSLSSFANLILASALHRCHIATTIRAERRALHEQRDLQ